jgi:hypothetical protein
MDIFKRLRLDLLAVSLLVVLAFGCGSNADQFNAGRISSDESDDDGILVHPAGAPTGSSVWAPTVVMANFLAVPVGFPLTLSTALDLNRQEYLQGHFAWTSARTAH